MTANNSLISIKNRINRYNNNVSFILIIGLITFGLNQLNAQESEDKFIDTRDNSEYKVITIDNQVWLAENLRFATDNSWIYNNDSTLLEKHGRLYTWNSVLQAIPDGWRLPTESDLKELIDYLIRNINGIEKQGNNWTLIGGYLKSKEEWLHDGIGTDDFGFNAVPSGYRVEDE